MSLFSHFSRITKEEHEEQQAKELAKPLPATVKQEKRPVGRPKKRAKAQIASNEGSSSGTVIAIDTDEGSNDEKHVSRRKEHYIDWFASPFVHDIIAALRLHNHSIRSAIRYLQQKYPKLPTERSGRFDALSQSTVRHWYVNGTNDFKWEYQIRLEGAVLNHTGGRVGAFHGRDRLVEIIVTRLKALRDQGHCTLSVPLIAPIIRAIIQIHDPELLEKIKLSREFVRLFVRRELNWAYRKGNPTYFLYFIYSFLLFLCMFCLYER